MAANCSPLPEEVVTILDNLFQRFPVLTEIRDSLICACQNIVCNVKKGGILYICGNGGSFADALHIKAELGKSFERKRPISDPAVLSRLRHTTEGQRLAENLEVGLPVIVLGESHGLRSAFENDCIPTFTYAQELNSFAAHIRPGVLLGISTSGNAQNVISAVILAQAHQMATIALTGPHGGRLAEIAQISLRVPVAKSCPADVQEHHLPVYHALCRMVEAHLFPRD